MAFDGSSMNFVFQGAAGSSNPVFRLRAANFSPVEEFAAQGGLVGLTMGIAFDGKSLWVTNSASNTVSKR